MNKKRIRKSNTEIVDPNIAELQREINALERESSDELHYAIVGFRAFLTGMISDRLIGMTERDEEIENNILMLVRGRPIESPTNGSKSFFIL